jgi:aryl-alcohol dehydrogenase-like predicted oxidoreductase
LNDLVREGKILHYGFSDTPAWYVARAYTLAEKEGKDHVAALQLEYSLVERNIEREHIPVAQELGLAVCPWSPIAGGFLAGKYRREGDSGRGEGRLEQTKDHPVLGKVLRSEQNWRIVNSVVEVAKKLGKTPAQVALNWVATQPGVTSTIIGATKLAQLEDNFRALEFTLPAELRQQLDEVSALPSAHPYLFFGGVLQAMIRGNVPIQPWRRAHATGASEPTVASAKTAAAD